MKNVPWAHGLIAGVFAYITAFSGTTVLFVLEEHPEWIEAAKADESTTFDVLGLIFYGSQFVGLSGPEGAPFGQSINILTLSPPNEIPVVVFFMVPVIVLLIAGFVIVFENLPQLQSMNEAAAVGALVVIGYGLLMIAGSVMFSLERSGQIVRMDTGYAIVIGLIYPVLFGSLGGICGYTFK